MRTIAALVAILSLGACGSAIPEIARDLPATYKQGEKVFDARLKCRFPVGTPEQELVRMLGEQGFPPPSEFPEVGKGPIKDSTFTKREFPFETIWSVRWKTDHGRINQIWGVYGVRAP